MDDEKYATHLFSYPFEGAKWTIDIRARDEGEARRRLQALAWATYDGELIARFPVLPGPISRLVSSLRRIARSMLR